MGAVWDGFLGILGQVLAFFYDLIPSYGLSIIFLTILINLVLFPLTLKQTRSTRAFQALQPQIQRIQKEYKDRPQELQQEMMRVQREAGVSPGGCLLPMIVQMPFLIGLFWTLRNPLLHVPSSSALFGAIESRTERFLGMALDVTPSQALGMSTPDVPIVGEPGLLYAAPYLLIMVLMVMGQYVQQWHATHGIEQTGPAGMQLIPKILPLFIGFISFNFPAGLVLYWATAQFFRLGQQALIFKIDGRPQPVKKLEESDNKGTTSQPSPEKTQNPQPGAAKKRRKRKRR